MATRLSGMQHQVLSLYRRALRMTRMKPPGTRPKFRLLIAYTFRKNAHAVTSRDFSAIEYMLRQGVKQVEMYENPAIRDCILSEEIKKWGEKRERDGEGEPRW